VADGRAVLDELGAPEVVAASELLGSPEPQPARASTPLTPQASSANPAPTRQPLPNTTNMTSFSRKTIVGVLV
jgi:hypothetical protein